MKICIISDTHSYHRDIIMPEADMLICAGDLSFRGEMNIIEDFSNWMKGLPYKHKITIFGNHETGTEYGKKRDPALRMIRDAGIHYLENSKVVINGLKIFGSPVTPTFFNWEYNVDRGAPIAKVWANIPDDTDILITHGPPLGILDEAPRGVMGYENVGCEDLLKRVLELKQLKAHCFGHIHNGYGLKTEHGIQFVNASICTENYKPTNLPIVIDI